MATLVAGITGQLGLGFLEHRGCGSDDIVALVREWRLRNDGSVRLPASTGGFGRVVIGDVGQENWGISRDELMALAPNVDCVINLAGSTDWLGHDAELAQDNVLGAVHGLRLARLLSAHRGAPVPYLFASTVFVAGSRTGRVEERLLPPSVDRAPYERSKWLAEHHLLHEAQAERQPLIVARFAALIGRSTDGATARRNSLYLLPDIAAKALLRLVPLTPGARVDVLPRDHAGRFLTALVDAARMMESQAIVHVGLGDSAPRLAALLGAIADKSDGSMSFHPLPVPGRILISAARAAIQLPSGALGIRRVGVGLRHIGIPRVFADNELRRLLGDAEVERARPSLDTIVRTLVGRPTTEHVSVGRDWR